MGLKDLFSKETTDEESFAVQFFQSTWGYAQPGATSTGLN